MKQDDFIRLINDGDTDDRAYIRSDKVLAISPRVHPQLGILPGATIVMEGGLGVQVNTPIERVAELLGIAQEEPNPGIEDAMILVES